MMKQMTKQKTMMAQTIATEMKSRRLLRFAVSESGGTTVDSSCRVLAGKVVDIVVNERATELRSHDSFIKTHTITNVEICSALLPFQAET